MAMKVTVAVVVTGCLLDVSDNLIVKKTSPGGLEMAAALVATRYLYVSNDVIVEKTSPGRLEEPTGSTTEVYKIGGG